MKEKKIQYSIDIAKAAKIVQMKGLETTILTGLSGERMMMAINATLPGYSVPMHAHPHEQIGMVYSDRSIVG